ncbi:relaxase/mobilization nuclease domain-containing protein, partial [Staphylococcus shinii]|uniref:relaxase/mobilization nuclease domain-containing protein n=1 Tax=Staphylococcus shinii TaxID=2912228 RepID=UPI002E17D212|nr:relaxase/mobilization nuclease domain-containing protein [Staphylococcus shinii]
MATTKISSTKSTSRAINYAEKRAEEKSALNCDIDYAKSSFKATREMYGKTDGNEGHVVIQSFKPNEVTPEQCNQLGLELAEKIAPNHQVAVYTHNDTDHVHNHIVINSIDLETGKKFNNNKKALHDIRQANDEVCRSHNLSIPEEKANLRYTQAEQNIIDKANNDKASWKNQVRMAIEETKEQATDFDDFKQRLETKGVEVARVTNKTITYLHIEENKKVRGNKLGEDYEKGEIVNAINKQKQSREQPVRKPNVDFAEFERRNREKRNQRELDRAKQTHSRENGHVRREQREEKQEDRPTHRTNQERG